MARAKKNSRSTVIRRSKPSPKNRRSIPKLRKVFPNTLNSKLSARRRCPACMYITCNGCQLSNAVPMFCIGTGSTDGAGKDAGKATAKAAVQALRRAVPAVFFLHTYPHGPYCRRKRGTRARLKDC